MNQYPGLIGKKLGCSQLFDSEGNVHAVTLLEVGPCHVVGKRTIERDSYSAIILGYGEKRESLFTKPELGFFKKAGVKPLRFLRELRLPPEEVAKYEVGKILRPSEVFEIGQWVDVTGYTKGRGFTGVMKRWNFSGAGSKTHGTHEYKRHGGAIGTNMTPGRTLPNMKMAGHYGNERVTIQNLRVMDIVDDDFLLVVKGAVPGPRHGLIIVRGAVKKGGGKIAKAA
ncbi:MAG: 50S ribosomal protein L3 [Sandaracinaceae bacterium]|nr:50S ribosomal protein L3 [Sandaracinaceae bacterium]